MSDKQLDQIIDLLNRHRQRATYGAVGALVDRPASFLMGGRPRDRRHSWIVNQTTELPTGYGQEDMHPDLRSRAKVLKTSQELQGWLNEVRLASQPSE
jgi:hypothetical protein